MFCGAREPFESKFISFLKGTLKFFFTDDPKYRDETYMRYELIQYYFPRDRNQKEAFEKYFNSKLHM